MPSMRYVKAAVFAALFAALGSGSAQAGIDVVIYGNTADYEIFDPSGNGTNPIPAGPADIKLTVDAEDVGAPGYPYNRSNVIYQFDISTITAPIAAADFSSVMAEKFAGIPTNDVDLYGSTANRSSFLLSSDPAAGAEMDAASYTKLNPGGTPYVDNVTSVNGTRYFQDITSFLQARYADYLGDNTLRWVFFRLQIAEPLASSNAFYDFNSADAGQALAPRLDIELVPGPGVLALIALAATCRRRRR